MDISELVKLLGIIVVIVGFTLKLDSILTILIAAVTTAVIAGMDPIVFLQTLGKSFVSTRTMLICVVVFVLTGTLERNGLRNAARELMRRVKGASGGIIMAAYGVFRVIFAAFNVGFGGVAGFIKPVVMPMAEAADDPDGTLMTPKHRDDLKGMASGMENVAWFFGQVLFVGSSGMLLVQNTLKELGYAVELAHLAAIEIPVALIAVAFTSAYYIFLDRRYQKRDLEAAAEKAGNTRRGIMDAVIAFYTSTDPKITLSTKLLEVVFVLIGLVAIYAGISNFRDKTNKKRIGTGVFWTMLGLLFIVGKWIPSEWTGVGLIVMLLPAVFKQVGRGEDVIKPTEEEMSLAYTSVGNKIFLASFSIGVFALLFAFFFPKISTLVGLTVGVFVGCGILLAMRPGVNTPKLFLDDSRRMLDIVGPLVMLPTLLSILGATFTAAGVGEVISHLVGAVIPEGNLVVGIIVYCVGMALFTAIMGNAFAAITVLTVGIGAPFVLSLGADPTVVGALALTCGFCGTLMTPMAANFNIVPVAILEMNDEYGVIKKQVIPAVFMLTVQILMMIVLVAF